jgi:Uma2 family endonuclease
MATVVIPPVIPDVDYPSSDGRPMGETPFHVKNLANLLFTLDVWFGNDPSVYVAGNMFVYYVEGDQHKHLSPDVFVVRGVAKTPERLCYLVWKEGKAPDAVVELTSRSIREEDLDDKFRLYQDILKVPEYFLFDPQDEYLEPSLRGYRLVNGKYVAIEPVEGRLPSEVLGLHLERDGWILRLYNPLTREWLPTIWEEQERRLQAEAIRQQEAAARQKETAARERVEAENERLRRELDALRQRSPKEP